LGTDSTGKETEQEDRMKSDEEEEVVVSRKSKGKEPVRRQVSKIVEQPVEGEETEGEERVPAKRKGKAVAGWVVICASKAWDLRLFFINRSSGKKIKAAADSGEGAVVTSKYGGYSEDEDQTKERAAAMAARGPQAKPKVWVHRITFI
jgi:hypothetical protein